MLWCWTPEVEVLRPIEVQDLPLAMDEDAGPFSNSYQSGSTDQITTVMVTASLYIPLASSRVTVDTQGNDQNYNEPKETADNCSNNNGRRYRMRNDVGGGLNVVMRDVTRMMQLECIPRKVREETLLKNTKSWP
jgi:hypothetical protein